MARNEDKHFCKLNRMILLKEIEEYNKAHPSRPKLDSLHDPQEIINWLPSIKKDIDFYLKKSQVTCYSDTHVEDCMKKVVNLEKEFKAFVRKIKKLTPSPLDAVPWTNRPYKRKKKDFPEESLSKDFKRIPTPILDDEKNHCESFSSRDLSLSDIDNWDLINSKPLELPLVPTKELENIDKKIDVHPESSILDNTNQFIPSGLQLTSTGQLNKDDNQKMYRDNINRIANFENCSTKDTSAEYDDQHSEPEPRTCVKSNVFNIKDKEHTNHINQLCKLVNYDSSGEESS